MKLLTRCIYAVLFMGFSLTLNASNEPNVSIRSQKGQSFSLHLKDIKNQAYQIKLSDKNGAVLLYEKVKDQDNYLKLYNLKNLPSGDYSLSIENDRKIILQDISVLNQQLGIAISTKREVYKPTIRYDSSYLNLDMVYFEEGIVKLIIKDKDSNVIYQDNIYKKGDIHKRFDMTALPTGNYMAEVATYHFTFEQKFSVGGNNKLSTSNHKRKKLDKNREVTTNVQKNKTPHTTDAIMNKIKWINSKNN